jgi:diguanylate cyclase (GGDEF)-like protein
MSTEKVKILLIEDSPVEVLIMRALLAKAESAQIPGLPCLDLVSANSLTEGLERLNEGGFELVLLDLSLPDSEGLETLAGVRAQGPQVPVVVLTWSGNEALAVQALQLGAQDYLVKGQLDPQVVVRAIRYAIERHRLLQSQSLTDELTGLYNLRGFRNLAEQHWKTARRSGNDFLLLYADLDDLKAVNDGFGHAAGSALIAGAAEILRETFRTSDIVARVGGDEFVALLIDVGNITEATILSRLNENIAQHNAETDAVNRVSLSVGMARFDAENAIALDDLIARADQMMYETKRAKKAKRLRELELPLVASFNSHERYRGSASAASAALDAGRFHHADGCKCPSDSCRSDGSRQVGTSGHDL